MAEPQVYNGTQEINVQIFLIKAPRGQRVFSGAYTGALAPGIQQLEINPQSILNLTLREAVRQMGLTGSITVDNEFNFLENLGLCNDATNDLYITINLKESEIVKHKGDSVPHGYNVLCKVTNLANASANAHSNIVEYIFEEAYVNALRTIPMHDVSASWKGADIGSLEGQPSRSTYAVNILTEDPSNVDVMGLADFLYCPRFMPQSQPPTGDQMGGILYTSTEEGLFDAVPNTYFHIDSTPNVAGNFGTGGVSTGSAYEYIVAMLAETSTSLNKCAYLRMTNKSQEGGVTDRKLKFSSYLTDNHYRFLNACIQEGTGFTLADNNKAFEDVYLEKFTIGPFADFTQAHDPNYTIHNRIEQYTIDRDSPQRLQEEVLCDYNIVNTLSPDSGTMGCSLHLPLQALQAQYVEREFSNNLMASNGAEGFNLGFNVAVLPPGVKSSEKTLLPNCTSTKDLATQSGYQQHNYAYNQVASTYLNSAETITFTSRGSLIREPNKFIWIEQSNSGQEGDYDNGTLDKLWYVNNVTHVFENSEYTTQVQATKFFGNTPAQDISEGAYDELAQQHARMEAKRERAERIKKQKEEGVSSILGAVGADSTDSVSNAKIKEIDDMVRVVDRIKPKEIGGVRVSGPALDDAPPSIKALIREMNPTGSTDAATLEALTSKEKKELIDYLNSTQNVDLPAKLKVKDEVSFRDNTTQTSKPPSRSGPSLSDTGSNITDLFQNN